LEKKILFPNDQVDILYVPDETSVKMNPSEGQPRQPLEKALFSAFASPFFNPFPADVAIKRHLGSAPKLK
jgi:hypothetical protein